MSSKIHAETIHACKGSNIASARSTGWMHRLFFLLRLYQQVAARIVPFRYAARAIARIDVF